MMEKLLRKWFLISIATVCVVALSYIISTRTYFVITTVAYMKTIIVGISDAMRQNSSDANELRTLRIKSAALTARVELMKHIQRENNELREALGRENEDLQLIFARVLANSPSIADDFLILDGGTLTGISTGMSALVKGTIHIGTVVKATSKSSTVQLLSHANEKIEVYLPDSNVSSVAVGQGGRALEIQVPASIEINEGEPVLSIGPPDFLIGYVEKVEKSVAGPFQLVYTSHPISLTDLRHVFLIIQNKSE